MKVLITDKINEKAGEIIQDVALCDFLPTMDEDELSKVIQNYDAILIRSQTKMTKKVFENAKNLKIVARAGVGVDNVDLEEATMHGVVVVNSPDGNTHAASEHTIALMMALSRNIVEACNSTKQGKWERSRFTGNELFGKTLGVIGFGKIGNYVAKVAKALGMNILVYDPFTSRETVELLAFQYCEKLEDFWPKCDYITIHTPKTPETVALINKNTINQMKQGVFIINCARGAIVDENALYEALESGKVKGAAIDVFENEPDIGNCALLKCGEDKNIILTPHLGASTKEAQLNVAIDVAKDVRNVLSGKEALNAVNLPQMSRQKLEPVKKYMKLAMILGDLASQLTDSNIESIDLTFSGNLSMLDTSALEIAILKGIFQHKIEGVNFVNARFVVEKRGIKFSAKKVDGKTNYDANILVEINKNNSQNSLGFSSVLGVLTNDETEKIIKVNDFETSIFPENRMLFVVHQNKPSMVAKVATELAQSSVNINSMYVAPSIEKKTCSLMILNIDKNISNNTLTQLSAIEGVLNPKFIELEI